MSVARDSHTAWTPPSLPDSIVLLGGSDSANLTAETVPGGGSFDLRHSGYSSCGIPDAGDTIVLTGGHGHNYVTRYNVTGFVEELPQLPENRYDHACGALPATGALVVAGGVIPGLYGSGYTSSLTSSVLTLLPGAANWTSLVSLPRPLFGARASIVGGRLRVTGSYRFGYYFSSEVFEYQPQPWNQWITIGRFQHLRSDHAVLSVGFEQLPCLSECPPARPSLGHLCVAPAGAQDCHYESSIYSFGGNVNCCCGRCDSNVTCAPDSTTGSGFWQPIHFPLCPAEGCGSEGVVTSPNHPGNYPNDLKQTETIQVEQGLTITLEFSDFQMQGSVNFVNFVQCRSDSLRITDGDGTTLMERSCGSTSDGNVVIGGQSIGSSLPPAIKSRSNTINLVFTTGGSSTRSGWSVSWRAVAG